MTKRILFVASIFGLLTSCAPKNFFTIQVLGEHFSSQPITFKEGDRSKKEIKINLDEGYEVFGEPIFSNPEAGEGIYHIDTSTLSVFPNKDLDFSVQLNTREKADTKTYTITISGDHLKTSDITFKGGDRSKKEIVTNLDEGYVVSGNPVISDPSVAEVFYRSDDSTLVVMPLKDQNFNITVNSEQKVIDIKFDAEENFINKSDFHIYSVSNVLFGTNFKEIGEKYYSTRSNSKFAGWSLEPGGYGEIIKEDFQIKENLTVYASFTNNVNFVSETLDFTYEQISSSEDLKIFISVKEDKINKYEIPLTKDAFTFAYNDETNETIPEEFYTYDRENSLLILKKEKANAPITLTAVDYQPVYKIEEGEVDNIFIKKYDTYKFDNVKKGEDFIFELYAENNYVVPTFLDIRVNEGEPLSLGTYTIQTYNPGVAIVTINGNVVKGNIVVSGEGIQSNYVSYKVETYGCHLNGLNNEGYFFSNEPYEFVFEPNNKDDGGTYKAPKAENIHIALDPSPTAPETTAWFNPIEGTEITGEVNAVYNSETGKLIINKNKVKSDRGAIDIKIRCPDYPLLEKLSWTKIGEICNTNCAKDFFYLGETKTLKFNGIDTSVRIIGFEQDTLYSDTNTNQKADITFMFTEEISESQWHYLPSTKRYNYNFLNSHLKQNTENCFSGLEESVKTLIKKVNKKCSLAQESDKKYYNEDFECLLFSPAFEEIKKGADNFGEGTLYQYFENHGCDVEYGKFSKENQYWLRTPIRDPSFPDRAYSLYNYNGGVVFQSSTIDDRLGICPMFCI